MLTFLMFLKEDKQEGEGDVQWHVSTSRKPIRNFRPMTHFGTKEAGRQRAFAHAIGDDPLEGPKHAHSVHAVRIKHGKSFEISDIGDHEPLDLLWHLHHKGMFSKQETEHHENKMLDKGERHNNQYLAKAINSKGYDSLHYKNTVEDHDSTSHIITRSDQVRVLKTKSNPKKSMLFKWKHDENYPTQSGIKTPRHGETVNQYRKRIHARNQSV